MKMIPSSRPSGEVMTNNAFRRNVTQNIDDNTSRLGNRMIAFDKESLPSTVALGTY